MAQPRCGWTIINRGSQRSRNGNVGLEDATALRLTLAAQTQSKLKAQSPKPKAQRPKTKVQSSKFKLLPRLVALANLRRINSLAPNNRIDASASRGVKAARRSMAQIRKRDP